MKRLLLLLALLSAAACSGTQSPSATPPQPSTVPAPRSPNGLTSVSTAPRTVAEPRIRVGMLSDQRSVSFPRTEGGYLLVADAGPATLRRGFTATAPQTDAAVRYAVQVAALSDKTSVDAFVQRIRTETGQRVDALFDPSASNGGIYRILVGDFADSASATPVRDDLVRRGYGQNMTTVRRPSDLPFEKRIAITDDEGEHDSITGQSVLVMPLQGDTIAIGDKPYRTAARIFINERGLLNVINELNLEDYLRGVVPAEMGPKSFDEIEALKAQAIAARTYAVRNMNQFAREGFDICPGPACQAYLGFSGEDPLSSRAVTDTAGLVMTWNGSPIDALYTATCGGETSDVATMFPGRSEPYLKRVRCVELETIPLAGRADSGLLDEMQMNARVFAAIARVPESGSSWSAADVTRAVAGAARVIGWQGRTDYPIASSRRGDVLRYLAAVFGLDSNARVLTLPEDRKYFFPQSGTADDAEHQAAAFLVKFGVWPSQAIDRIDLQSAMPRDELYAVLGAWLRKHEMLKEATGKIAALDGRRISVKAEGKTTAYQLPAGIPAYRKLGDRYQEYASLPVMIGDRTVILLDSRNTPVAVVVTANYDGASFDRTSSFANWTRSYRANELVESINKRNPIQQLLALDALSVDPSHRVIELQVTAEGGRKFTLKGLPIRWSLNVPDNLFVIEKTKDADGVDRYTFFGKGWGHGVGLCQVGAYGMAFRGSTSDEILRHYYTGIEIVPMK